MGYTDNNGVYHNEPYDFGNAATGGDTYAAQQAASVAQTGVRTPYEGDNPNSDMNSPYRVGNGYSTPIAGYDNGLWTHVTKPTAYEYGGHRGGAAAEEDRYATLGAQADKRQAAQVNDWQYGWDRNLETSGSNGSRTNQDYGLQQYRDMITGQTPSVAQNQLGAGLAQAQQQNAAALGAARAATASRAASARGGGQAIASAQMQAAQIQGGQTAMANQNRSQLAQQASAQGNILQAQEQQNALQGYASLAQQQRAQDQSRGQLSADQGYQQAQLQQSQNQLNDARNMGYEGMRQKTAEDQMQSQQAGEAANAGAYLGQWQQQSQDQASKNSSYWGFGGLFQ